MLLACVYGVSAQAAAGVASVVAAADERSALLLSSEALGTSACCAACCAAQHQRKVGMLARQAREVCDVCMHARIGPFRKLFFEANRKRPRDIQAGCILRSRGKPTCVIVPGVLLGRLPLVIQSSSVVQHVGGPWCVRCALRLWAFPRSWRLWRWRSRSAAGPLRRAAWRGEAATRQPWCAPREAQPEHEPAPAHLLGLTNNAQGLFNSH